MCVCVSACEWRVGDSFLPKSGMESLVSSLINGVQLLVVRSLINGAAGRTVHVNCGHTQHLVSFPGSSGNETNCPPTDLQSDSVC